MSIRAILLPVFVHVAVVFVLLLWIRRESVLALGRGRVQTEAREPEGSSWRIEVELGILFYVLTISAWHTQFADLIFLLLAWVFVAIRVLNAFWSGETSRESFFISSAIVLAVMWIIYAIRLLLLLG